MSFEIKHKIIIYKKYLSGDQIHSILFNVWCLFLMLIRSYYPIYYPHDVITVATISHWAH